MNVIIDVPGLFLGKESGRIVARRNRELIGELPLDDVDTILIEGNGITLSSDAIAACAERGITVDFMSPLGDPLATIYSPVFNASVQTRRAQLAAYGDERGVTYARLVVGAKLAIKRTCSSTRPNTVISGNRKRTKCCEMPRTNSKTSPGLRSPFAVPASTTFGARC